MLVKRADMVEIECVARGYISGSGWKEYQRRHGLRHPAARGAAGERQAAGADFHSRDEGADRARRECLVRTRGVADRRGSCEAAARSHARDLHRGGKVCGDARASSSRTPSSNSASSASELVLGDEVLTPDSSRFWPADTYKPGGAQLSFDKQYVRDYLEEIRWNKPPPAPPLPEEVAAKTGEKYRQAYSVLTGREL